MRRSDVEMFDEFVSLRVPPDGIVEKRRYVTGEETLAEACGMLLSAERRFQRFTACPDVVSDQSQLRMVGLAGVRVPARARSCGDFGLLFQV
jgi:hypothetical protein